MSPSEVTAMTASQGSSGQERRSERAAKSKVKIKASENGEKVFDEYGWSRSLPNLSGKLKRGSLRYGEAVELADALRYDIVWQKRK